LENFPWSAIISALSALGGAFIGSHLSYQRTSKEKIWDLRRQAYGVIIAELAQIESILDDASEYIAQDAPRYFEEVVGKHNEKISAHFSIADKKFSDDYLVLSDEFIAIYTAMKNEYSQDPYEILTPEDDHEKFSAAIRKYRPKLLVQARTEIGVHKPPEKLRIVFR
jgi:hypothetical protein